MKLGPLQIYDWIPSACVFLSHLRRQKLSVDDHHKGGSGSHELFLLWAPGNVGELVAESCAINGFDVDPELGTVSTL